MSISAASMGGASLNYVAAGGQQRMKFKGPPPDMSQEDLTKLQSKLKSEGKDTTNLDKIISNFTDLDTDGSGKVSMDEVKSGSEKFGIEMPKGPPPPPPGGWGPPPGLLEESSDDSSTSSTDTSKTSNDDKLLTLLQQLLDKFKESNGYGTQGTESSVSISA